MKKRKEGREEGRLRRKKMEWKEREEKKKEGLLKEKEGGKEDRRKGIKTVGIAGRNYERREGREHRRK